MYTIVTVAVEVAAGGDGGDGGSGGGSGGRVAVAAVVVEQGLGGSSAS